MTTLIALMLARSLDSPADESRSGYVMWLPGRLQSISGHTVQLTGLAPPTRAGEGYLPANATLYLTPDAAAQFAQRPG